MNKSIRYFTTYLEKKTIKFDLKQMKHSFDVLKKISK